MKVIEGKLLVKGQSFGLVASRFNDFMTKELVSGCIDTLIRHGAEDKDITVVWVPGAFEIPLVAQRMAKAKSFDALICLGTIIRGATPHFDYIAAEVAKGV
ncbi:MAG: 6,7-dimethyl-8-ribityllumazine synthase, partial [Candidatus Omnitrophota bacterium]